MKELIYQALDMINVNSVREFTLPPDTYIGGGSCSRLGEALKTRNIHNVFIVIDEVIEKMGLANSMFRSLDRFKIKYKLCIQVSGEPESKYVEDYTKDYIASGCDGMIAIGGGSALDMGKAVALLAANPGRKVHDLLDTSLINNTRAPFIAVPTTAGTGSEASTVTVITDSETHHKHVIAHPLFIPDLAVIDACLMLRLPASITAATGVDALTHAIESYVATKATLLTRALSYQAIRQIGESLAIVTGRGDDVNARESMALASYMAGIAFSNAGLGLTHSMAHQIGPKYHVPHGVANAILLPSVMAFNELVCKKDFCDIGLALTGEIMSSRDAIDAVQNCIIELGLPANLQAVGGNEEDFEELAENAIKDYCLPTNPRTVSKKQIIQVYQHALRR